VDLSRPIPPPLQGFVFFASLLGLIPLAMLLGCTTESLAGYTNQVRKDAVSTQKSAQLQPFIAILPHECMGQLPNLHLWGQPNTLSRSGRRSAGCSTPPSATPPR
jgi:hypothetical protein